MSCLVFFFCSVGLPQWLSSKESACNAREAGDTGSISRLRRSPGGGHGNPHQYTCQENSMDRGGWRATVHRVAKSWAWLKWLSRSTTQNCMSCLHILKINHLSVVLVTNIYSQSIGCLFLLFMIFFFAVQRLKNLIRSHLFLLLFLLSWNTDHRKYWCSLSNNVLPVFSFGIFMVSCLIFKSLSHFELILMYSVRVCSNFISFRVTNFPNTTCWRDCFFPLYIIVSFVKLQLTIDVWVYFWALCSVLLIHMSIFLPIPCCFDYCSFIILSEVWEHYASYFVIFPQDCFGNSESFMVPYKF